MLRRACWVVFGLLFLGCHCLPGPEDEKRKEEAGQLWQEGQAAMRRGQPARAVGFYEQSLQANPSLTRNHMSLAAAHLERGDEASASVHLARYVERHPEHHQVRAQYAELLLRLGRAEDGRGELVRLAADVQELGKESLGHLVHCHSRLLEIAEGREDEYEAHLHRGIGLYHLARQRAALGDDPGSPLPAEGLLCKAAAELTLARVLRPDEARPCWYLYSVWSQLGQGHPARRWLNAASSAAPFSDLTPAEQRGLVMASRSHEFNRR